MKNENAEKVTSASGSPNVTPNREALTDSVAPRSGDPEIKCPKEIIQRTYIETSYGRCHKGTREHTHWKIGMYMVI